MTEQQQAACNAGLAQAMGYQLRLTMDNLPDAHVIAPDGKRLSLSELPDYFTDAETSRELVVWLAKQECTVGDQDHECYGDGLCLPFGRFIALVSNSWAVDRFCFNGHRFEVSLSGLSALLTLEPPTVARAACKALGIKVSE